MLAILFLIFSWIMGLCICKALSPHFQGIFSTRALFRGKAGLKRWTVWIPAGFVVGTVISVWMAYLMGYAVAGTGHSMRVGTTAAMLLAVIVSAIFLVCWRKDLHVPSVSQIRAFLRDNRGELIYLAVITAFWTFFCVRSFHMEGSTLVVGNSVYSDFCPHLSVIRSFSRGDNFPAQYPHFADGTIRYHFLFQFLVGCLEFLGLPIDWAFNLPSVLGLSACMLLLLALCVRITGRKGCAYLTAGLFTFRSSFAVFTFFAGAGGITDGVRKLFSIDYHIGNTLHEDWGLWSQKVYLNQRHLAFAMAGALLLILIFYPLFVSMIDGLCRRSKTPAKSREPWLKAFLGTRESWMPSDWVPGIAAGVLLGAMGFFNGAVVIATLCVLAFMAIFSRERLAYLSAAVISVGLVLCQSKLFIPVGEGAVSPAFYFGFLAEEQTVGSVCAYLLELLGILPILLILGIFILPKGARCLSLAFFSPVILAEMLSLTPDITVNHKYIMFACVLADVIVAGMLGDLFSKKTVLRRAAAALACILLMLTGVCDLITLWNIDHIEARFDTESPLLAYVSEETPAGALFLTDTTYALGDVLLAGRLIYNGWPYFAWSAGYDTDGRTVMANTIYSAQDADALRGLCAREGIDYILVDDSNRSSQDYVLNEQLIAACFPAVFRDRDSVIYQVSPASSR